MYVKILVAAHVESIEKIIQRHEVRLLSSLINGCHLIDSDLIMYPKRAGTLSATNCVCARAPITIAWDTNV